MKSFKSDFPNIDIYCVQLCKDEAEADQTIVNLIEHDIGDQYFLKVNDDEGVYLLNIRITNE